MQFASIDIGSNSILLCIAEAIGKNIRLLQDECRVTGLAKGSGKTGIIAEAAFERSKQALQEYRDILSRYPQAKIRAVATESLRRPKNGPEIRQSLEEILGHEIEIISGEKEAELSFWSVQHEHPQKEVLKIVFDIGGASTELILGHHDGIQCRDSMKVGSVLLTEEFGLDAPSIPDDALRRVKDLISKTEVFKEIKNRKTMGVGVAGTITTLAAIELEMTEYQRDRVHLMSISQTSVQKWLKRILLLPLSEREKIKGLPVNRADVFGAGVLIVKALIDSFSWNQITCMDSGVRMGLIYEMAREGTT